MTHNLNNNQRQYPLYHTWLCANRMNLYSNVPIKTDDLISVDGKTFKVGIMFPDINDSNYIEDGLNPNITKDTAPILSHLCTTGVINDPEMPFITKNTRFYEFETEEDGK